MQLIILHKNEKGLLRFAFSDEPIASVILEGLSKLAQLNGNTEVVLAIPENWNKTQLNLNSKSQAFQVEHYNQSITFSYWMFQQIKQKNWLTILNGRFATQTDTYLIKKVLDSIQADIISVTIKTELLPYNEKVQLTTQGKIAGFRRIYSNCAQWTTLPIDWPHYLFVKTNIISQILTDYTLPLNFSQFIDICLSKQLVIRSVNIGGNVLDLDTEKGLLDFMTIKLSHHRSERPGLVKFKHNALNYCKNGNHQITFVSWGLRVSTARQFSKILDRNNIRISAGARLFGQVLFGRNVSIAQDAIIVGPAIIGSNVKIAKGAVVRSSIIGSDVSIPANSIIQSTIINSNHKSVPHILRYQQRITNDEQPTTNGKQGFRTWPRLSYARCFKRIADIIASIIVLVLFAPVFPIIALVIKLTSRGPILFKDTRQGLHGKPFKCLKFRTMLLGADKIQDKLRVLNQADGPQFRISDDPRVSRVGKFLRDTYIDEIPQFFNVLLGQMSVVGPRPSPESENTLCPYWRDARLSVRPGITGLWQVCRTRQPMKDFQEWIYYDLKYVRNLSLKMDLWICWQTAKKMVKNFINQF